MELRELERALAIHCAPALLGVKAASLISLPAEKFPQLTTLAGQYNAQLQGPRFLVLGHCRERTLLLVYRPELLEAALHHPLAEELLKEAGYEVQAPLAWQLRRLMERLEGEGDFPHEVGLFLGYPPEDVVGFLTDKTGTGCKLCGTWKVYHDVEGAQKKFHLYKCCQQWLEKKLDQGETLTSLLGRRDRAA